MLEILSERFIYVPIIVLMMTGLYVVVATGNLVKRLVGLSLFQTSVCLLYIAVGKVFGGEPPILADAHGSDGGHGEEAAAAHGDETAYAAGGDHADDGHGEPADTLADAGHAADAGHGADAAQAADLSHAAEPLLYSNPLPHVLILTAIVVGVATLAVGLALVVRIREAYGTIEDEALNAADYSVDTGGNE